MTTENERPAEMASTLSKLVAAIECGELTAPPHVVARLEGAIVVLEVLATGRSPSLDDFLASEQGRTKDHRH